MLGSLFQLSILTFLSINLYATDIRTVESFQRKNCWDLSAAEKEYKAKFWYKTSFITITIPTSSANDQSLKIDSLLNYELTKKLNKLLKKRKIASITFDDSSKDEKNMKKLCYTALANKNKKFFEAFYKEGYIPDFFINYYSKLDQQQKIPDFGIDKIIKKKRDLNSKKYEELKENIKELDL